MEFRALKDLPPAYIRIKKIYIFFYISPCNFFRIGSWEFSFGHSTDPTSYNGNLVRVFTKMIFGADSRGGGGQFLNYPSKTWYLLVWHRFDIIYSTLGHSEHTDDGWKSFGNISCDAGGSYPHFLEFWQSFDRVLTEFWQSFQRMEIQQHWLPNIHGESIQYENTSLGTPTVISDYCCIPKPFLDFSGALIEFLTEFWQSFPD